jgi:hypothetical protein
MTELECLVDSITVTLACPDELTLILKQKAGGNTYLRVLISYHQGKLLKSELHGRPDKGGAMHAFVADNDVTDADIRDATSILRTTSCRQGSAQVWTCGHILALPPVVRRNE